MKYYFGYGSSYNNATTPNGLAPVKIPEKIIDYDVGGYSSSGTGYFTVLALTESNTLYAFGYNNYYASNNTNETNGLQKEFNSNNK